MADFLLWLSMTCRVADDLSGLMKLSVLGEYGKFTVVGSSPYTLNEIKRLRRMRRMKLSGLGGNGE